MFGFLRKNVPPPGEVGMKMPDGSIYAGMSPKTHRPMYVTRDDAPMYNRFGYSLYDAEEYAARLYEHGNHDWRLPTVAELKVLFNNRAAIGGFETDSVGPWGHYWSSSWADRVPFTCDLYWQLGFKDGEPEKDPKISWAAVRCVRSP